MPSCPKLLEEKKIANSDQKVWKIILLTPIFWKFDFLFQLLSVNHTSHFSWHSSKLIFICYLKYMFKWRIIGLYRRWYNLYITIHRTCKFQILVICQKYRGTSTLAPILLLYCFILLIFYNSPLYPVRKGDTCMNFLKSWKVVPK